MFSFVFFFYFFTWFHSAFPLSSIIKSSYLHWGKLSYASVMYFSIIILFQVFVILLNAHKIYRKNITESGCSLFILNIFHVMFLFIKLRRKGKFAHLFSIQFYSAHKIYAAFVLFTQLKIQMLCWMTLANCCLLS